MIDEKLFGVYDGSFQMYVVGFLFKMEGLKKVCLIEKLRPEWQIGLLNGIGGKIDKGEFPLDAMRREFKEETGADVQNWRPFLYLQPSPLSSKKWGVLMYVSEDPADPKTTEDEIVDWYNVTDIYAFRTKGTIPNLRWIIPMALDKDKISATVTEI